MSTETQRKFKAEMEKLRREKENQARYLCPVCKKENTEDQKYCTHCGTWLQSSTFPATKVSELKPKGRGRGLKYIGSFIIASLVLIGLINMSDIGLRIPGTTNISTTKSFKFGEMNIAEKYTISQMVVSRPSSKTPTVTADFKTQIDTTAPLEVSAVFYDTADNRLGKATSLIGNALAQGYVTTLSFQFDEEVGDMRKLANVRVEVQELSPLMLIERTANRMKSLPQ